MSANEDLQREFRDTIGMFATGVTVVVAAKDGELHAMTANAVASLSLEPTLLIFCPAKEARISALCQVGGSFTVNILSRDQEGISNHFAGADTEAEHEFVDWGEPGDAPRIARCLASIGCRIRDMFEGGDHWIVVGEVTRMCRDPAAGEPLLFYRGGYRALVPDPK